MNGSHPNILPKNFDHIVDGQAVSLYAIANKNGLQAYFTNYGQHLIAFYVPDRNGNFSDIVLGFSSLEKYFAEPCNYFGSVIGRHANRITNGQLNLEGNSYSLARNNGTNHLHGGNKGFDSVVWDVAEIGPNCLEFYRILPDGEEGYPGNLDIRVRYLLTNDNTLKISYAAKTDKTTTVNLTNHSFFNLRGEGNGSVRGHELRINAKFYTPVHQNMATIGTIASVHGTPMGFSKSKTIGLDLESNHPQMLICGGYNHNYVLDKIEATPNVPQHAATVFEPQSGRTMEVYTTEPGMQLYTSNALDGTLLGKAGKGYEKYAAFCLETQHFPDSPNHKQFPSTILHVGETYRSITEYRFSVQ